MQTFEVDGLAFEFDDDWTVGRFDDWAFYRRQFSRMWNGIRAVDLLAVDPSGALWLIEAKNYSTQARVDPQQLDQALGEKVFDTLAALLPAKLNGNDAEEVDLAGRALEASLLHVVFHLEQPLKHSRLRPRAINPADVFQALRRRIKPIAPHPMVVESTTRMPWSVSRT